MSAGGYPMTRSLPPCAKRLRTSAPRWYRVQSWLVSIYVMTSGGPSPTRGTRIEHVGRTVVVIREGRLTQASWTKDGLIYSVVGEALRPWTACGVDDMHL